VTASKSTATKKTAETIPAQGKDEQGDGVVVELTGETDNRSLLEKTTSLVKENKKTLLAMVYTAAMCGLFEVARVRYATMKQSADEVEETPAA